MMPKVKSKKGGGGPLPIDLIHFVVPSSTDSSSNTTCTKNSENLPHPRTADGEATRSFYESVVQLQENSERNMHHVKTHKDKTKAHRTAVGRTRIKSEPNYEPVESQTAIDYFKMRNSLFSNAESGNMKELKQLIEKGVDVNCQDQYGWTALMCAAHSGHSSVVSLLLDCGSNASIRNAKGQSAWDIAQSVRKHNVLDAITHHGNETHKSQHEDVDVNESFMCEVCDELIEGTAREKHYASTVHQLNMAHPVNDTVYSIPGHNRGYQLMLKSGWDQDKGLGPSGTGQKFPVKTHLKRDRKGLGVKVKDSKARVTHFEPFDKKAVEHKQRQERAATLSKRAASKRARKEKEMEKRYRMEWT